MVACMEGFAGYLYACVHSMLNAEEGLRVPVRVMTMYLSSIRRGLLKSSIIYTLSSARPMHCSFGFETPSQSYNTEGHLPGAHATTRDSREDFIEHV